MNLKFRSIIDQTATFTYNAARVILDHLSYLCKNQYSIDDTQRFSNLLSSYPPLQDGKEDVRCNPGPLFVNIPIEKSINNILEQIYIKKKLTTICSKLSFRGLLVKLTTECTFKFNNIFMK